jgi:hypothetical protein
MLSYDEGHGTDCPERAAITSVSPALITLTRIERAQGPGGGKVLPHRQRVCLPVRDGRSYLAALARRNGQGLGWQICGWAGRGHLLLGTWGLCGATSRALSKQNPYLGLIGEKQA